MNEPITFDEKCSKDFKNQEEKGSKEVLEQFGENLSQIDTDKNFFNVLESQGKEEN